MADGDERGERQRERHGRVQRVGESNTGARTGTLTIAGQTFTVTRRRRRALMRCADQPVGRRRGGSGSTAVTATTGCAWTGVSNATSWLTVTSGASGNGNGTVAFSFAANRTERSATGR